jgi:hypothetical protein
MLLDLRPADLVQQELALEDDVADPGGSRLMQALDAVNRRFGRNTLSLASAGLAGEPRQSLKNRRWRSVNGCLGGNGVGERGGCTQKRNGRGKM